MLISDEIRAKHYYSIIKKKKSPVMIQEHFHQEAISFLNIYVLNNRASVHMEKKKKTDTTSRRNRQIQNYSWKFQHLLLKK